jgi:hypothetical protein
MGLKRTRKGKATGGTKRGYFIITKRGLEVLSEKHTASILDHLKNS